MEKSRLKIVQVLLLMNADFFLNRVNSPSCSLCFDYFYICVDEQGRPNK